MALDFLCRFQAAWLHRRSEGIEKSAFTLPADILGSTDRKCLLRQLKQLSSCVDISIPGAKQRKSVTGVQLGF
jgi:hypothetical protein